MRSMAVRQALKSSADDVLQHLAVKRQIGHELAQLGILVLKLLQTPHLKWRHAVVLLLPVEIRRLADPSPPADIGDGNPVSALLENERLLRVRELRSPHRTRPPQPRETGPKTLTQNAPVSREQTSFQVHIRALAARGTPIVSYQVRLRGRHHRQRIFELTTIPRASCRTIVEQPCAVARHTEGYRDASHMDLTGPLISQKRDR